MNNIKKARMSRGMSQAELGKAVGLSASTIGMIEQGRRLPSIRTLMKLRKVLGYSEVYLLGKDDEMEPYCLHGQPEPILLKDSTLDESTQKPIFIQKTPKVITDGTHQTPLPPIFRLLLMGDHDLAKIIRRSHIVGEYDVNCNGKLVHITQDKLKLFHATLRVILGIGE